MYPFFNRKFLFSVANRQTENLKITLESKNALGVQYKLGLLEQRTSLLIAMEFLFCGPQIFPQTVMWPFMLAVLDHPDLDYSTRGRLEKTFFKWGRRTKKFEKP